MTLEQTEQIFPLDVTTKTEKVEVDPDFLHHVMVDLETLGTGSDAAIVAIGAVHFTVAGGITDKFYRVVQLDSSMTCGGSVSASTILWWLKQSEAARNSICDPSAVHINVALLDFTTFLSPYNKPIVWGNGATFDNIILHSAYHKALSMKAPWSHRQDLCYRTLRRANKDIPRIMPLIPHHALHDAEAQALHCIQILKRDQHMKNLYSGATK